MLARNIHDEDTIEMQLSAADLEALTRAADAAEAAEESEAAERPAPASAAPVSPISTVAPLPSDAIALAAAPPVATERTPPALAEVARAPAPAAPERVPGVQTSVGPRTPAVAPLTLSVWPAVIEPAAALRPVQTPSVEQAPAIVPPASAKPIAAKPLVARPISAKPAAAIPPRRPLSTLSRFSTLGLRLAAAAIVAIAAVVAIRYWPITRTPEPATTPAAPATITAPVRGPAPHPAPEPPGTEFASTDPPPVRFANPFDSSEVFEFPAGTSYVEARDQVAQVLLARAKERHTLPPPARKTTATTRPAPSNKEASLARRL
jgi:hypothetical protein